MVKHVAEIIPSNIDKLTKEGETTVRLCNYTDVYNNEKIGSKIVTSLMVASASERQIQKLTLQKDDVIITKDSETQDDIGIPAFVSENLPGVVKVVGKKDGKKTEFPTDGVFVFIGLLPNTQFLENSGIELDKVGLIKTDSTLQTSIKGVFAAGDVRSGATMQIASAAGEGATAALRIREFLEDKYEGL
jgi:alkyl hydroperoxide reductase subunit AhpF